MLDWLWSKLIVAFATLVLLSSVSIYFVSERGQSMNEELDVVVHSLASFVDSVLDLSGTAEFSVGPDRNEDLVIPREIGGKPYSIELWRDSVVAGIGRHTVAGHWSGDLHFWQWDGTPLDSSSIQVLDESHPGLNIISGQRFQLSLEVVLFGDVDLLMAFAVRTI